MLEPLTDPRCRCPCVYRFMIKDTAQEQLRRRPRQGKVRGRRVELLHPPRAPLSLLAPARVSQLGTSPNPPLRGSYGGSMTWAWLIKSLTTGDELNLPRSLEAGLEIITSNHVLVFLVSSPYLDSILGSKQESLRFEQKSLLSHTHFQGFWSSRSGIWDKT